MNNIIKIIGFLLIFTPNISWASDCLSKCQITQVEAYFEALDKVARKGSTVTDIDNLLALMHDDVKYVHVEYEADFNKDTWRKAFQRNLNLGRYQKSNKHEKRILKSISGKNHIAIEYSNGVIQKDGQWLQGEPLLAVFRFQDGKISLVKELW